MADVHQDPALDDAIAAVARRRWVGFERPVSILKFKLAAVTSALVYLDVVFSLRVVLEAFLLLVRHVAVPKFRGFEVRLY